MVQPVEKSLRERESCATPGSNDQVRPRPGWGDCHQETVESLCSCLGRARRLPHGAWRFPSRSPPRSASGSGRPPPAGPGCWRCRARAAGTGAGRAGPSLRRGAARPGPAACASPSGRPRSRGSPGPSPGARQGRTDARCARGRSRCGPPRPGRRCGRRACRGRRRPPGRIRRSRARADGAAGTGSDAILDPEGPNGPRVRSRRHPRVEAWHGRSSPRMWSGRRDRRAGRGSVSR